MSGLWVLEQREPGPVFHIYHPCFRLLVISSCILPVEIFLIVPRKQYIENPLLNQTDVSEAGIAYCVNIILNYFELKFGLLLACHITIQSMTQIPFEWIVSHPLIQYVPYNLLLPDALLYHYGFLEYIQK